MRNVSSVSAVVTCWNYPLIIATNDHTTTPVVLCCSNKLCLKDYYSIRDGTFFDSSKLPLERENSLAARCTLQTFAGGEGMAALSPIISRPTGLCGPRSSALQALVPQPSRAGISWISRIKSISSKIRLIIMINWISSIKSISSKLWLLLLLMCKVW